MAIEQNIRVIAQFKNEASQGLRELETNLRGTGQEASKTLKPLEETKGLDNIKKINSEARNAAQGGVKQLADAFKGISLTSLLSGDGAIGTIETVFDELRSSALQALAGIASAAAASFAVIRPNSRVAAEAIGDVQQAAQGAGAEVAALGATLLAGGIELNRNITKGAQAAEQALEVSKKVQETTKAALAAQNPLERAVIDAVARAEAAQKRLSELQELRGAGKKAPAKSQLAFDLDAAAKEARSAEAALKQARRALTDYEDRLRKFNQLQNDLGVKLNPAVAVKISPAEVKEAVAPIKEETEKAAVAAVAATRASFGQIAALIGGVFIGVTTLAVAFFEGLSAGIRSAADDTSELAEKLNITIERLEELRLIADETGTTVESLASTWDKLNKVLDRSDAESDRAAQAAFNLGLSIDELRTLKPEEAAGRIIDQYELLGKSSEATAATQVLLGNSFRNNLIAIKEAAAGTSDAADRIKQYGAVASDTLVRLGGEQEKAVNNLSLAFKGLGFQIAESSGKVLIDLAQNLADAINWLRQTEFVGKTVSLFFATLKLLIVDTIRALTGLVAALDAFKSGNFAGALAIIKETMFDIGEAFRNFNEQARDSVKAQDAVSEAARKAEQERIDRDKKRRAAAEEAKKFAADQLKLFEAERLNLLQTTALVGSKFETERIAFAVNQGSLKNLNKLQKQELLDLAKALDLRRAEFDLLTKKDELIKGQEDKAREVTLEQEALRFAKLSTEEREKQVFLLNELERIRNTKGLTDAEREDAQLNAKVLAERIKKLSIAKSEAATISQLVDTSQAAIEASVARNIELAKELLQERTIGEGDYVRFVLEQTKRITDLNQQAAEESSSFWLEAAKGIQNALSTFFFDFMQGRLEDLGASFKRVIDQMVANALAANLGQALFGNGFEKTGQLGGIVGNAFTYLKGIFGGAFAEGGMPPVNKISLVGERGPELFVPGVSGTIVPNSSLGGTTVHMHISAVDSKSFLQQFDAIKREASKMVFSQQATYNLRTV